MNFWQDRNVFVTGADGFIGSHLTERLVELGANVRTLCFYNSQASLGWLDSSVEKLRGRVEPVLGDIRDAGFVAAACKDVSIVFHLAALISIPYSYTAPESYVDTNIKGTLNVLNACRAAGINRLVHASTSEVYGTPENVPILESHPLRPQSPYAATKVAADQLALSFFYSFGLPAVVLRPFNTYGPRQSTRAVIPTIINQLERGATEIEIGRLDTKRDFTFIRDTVEGFVCAGQVAGIEGQTIQLGTGRSVSIGELLALVARIYNVSARPRQVSERKRPTASEVMVLESNPALAARLLNWKPRIGLEEGLRETIAWTRANLHHYPRLYHEPGKINIAG